MNTTKVKKDYLFEINGFEVKADTIYEVVDRPDPTAPSGMVRKGLSKTPRNGVDETYCVNGFPNSQGKITWDTGFYPESPCYSTVSDPKLKKAKVDIAVKNVLSPFKNMHGLDAFDHTQSEFFDRWVFRLWTKRRFNTADIEERAELYFALLTGILGPEEDKGNPKYKDNFYMLVDIEGKEKNEDELYVLQASVINQTQMLMKSDKNKLVAVMSWMDFPVLKSTENGTMTRIIMEYIKDLESAQRFQSYLDQADSELELDKFHIYMKLKEMSISRGVLSKTAAGVWFYEDKEVGPDLKTAADRIAKEQAFEEAKIKILIS